MSEMLAMVDVLEPKTPEQLTREEIQRQTLEAAALRLETQQGNAVYMAAWKAAARILRMMKP
jgi:hypothetical protein